MYGEAEKCIFKHLTFIIKVVPFFSDLAPAVGGIGVVFVDETPFGAHFFPGTVVTVPCIFQGKNIGFRACGPGAVLAAGGGDGADSEGVGTSVVYIVREIVGGSFRVYGHKCLAVFFQAYFVAVTSFYAVPYSVFAAPGKVSDLWKLAADTG